MTDQLLFTLDGKVMSARPGETIWQVARREGVDIPHLCWLPQPGYRADGNCRACMVEIEGERVLAASCIRKPTPDMVVKTATDRAFKARRMVMELLLADTRARILPRVAEAEERIQGLKLRYNELANQFVAEQGRWIDFNSRLDALERSLEKR